ncbi:hypothetical protein [Roseivirga sp.]|uniref:hypothetical protein n=1 Tax=Roseivirga sp. TaxID=1964215 RepID=UPI003B8ACD07
MKLKITTIAIILVSFLGYGYFIPPTEDYCLYMPVIKMGYCDETVLSENGEQLIIKQCTGADMGAPNPEEKKVCSGNALMPI